MTSPVKGKLDKKDDLLTGIGVSFAFHALLVSLITLKAVFFSTEPIEVVDAVRVDIIDLPDKIDPNKLADHIEDKPKPGRRKRNARSGKAKGRTEAYERGSL